METTSLAPLCTSQPPSTPTSETLARRLLSKGVSPTPKILRAIRKKEAQKSLRKLNKRRDPSASPPPSEPQSLAMEAESRFQIISREYRDLTQMLGRRKGESLADKSGALMVGKPWERGGGVGLREFSDGIGEAAGLLRRESLRELEQLLAERTGEGVRWLWDSGDMGGHGKQVRVGSERQPMRESDAIRFIIDKLIATNLSLRDWKFSRLMNYTGIQYTERNLLRIVEGLGARGHWRHAMSVVEWVYKSKNYRHHQSRFVYTKLLSVLGNARRPKEALRIFNLMREDNLIYPDMPAYRNIAVTLGQAGLVKELLNVMESMKQKPSKRIKNMRCKHWDRCLEPDVVVFNAVLNSCVSCKQWKGVFWVFEQMRQSSIKPTGATYGLAMEVMLKSGKYDLVHKFFERLRKSGFPPNALTYKVLVRTFWEEGKVHDAVEAVRDMERRGITGTAGAYYELACCLCFYGRWEEAMLQVERLKNLPLGKPLEVAFTGMIQSCLNSKHVNHAIFVFERMKDFCAPNIGTINTMLKVFGRNDMFARAKALFEETKKINDNGGTGLTLDVYSYNSMLEASAYSHQWEYFEHVYKEMVVSGFQVDQNKRAWVLVEASRAGKWHVLEHAFDMILEAGEIPHLSIFIEMFCQNTARHNYDRVVPIVNCMAHATLQVSEKQWKTIFSRNSDRIGNEELQKLLGVIRDGEILREETTVTNLLKSLEHLCGYDSFRAIANDNGMVGGISTFNCKNENLKYHANEVLDEKIVPKSDFFPEYCEDESDGEDEFSLGIDNSTSGFMNDEHNDPNCIRHGPSNSAVTEMILDSLTSHDVDSVLLVSPSASEILKTWQKNRSREDIRL